MQPNIDLVPRDKNFMYFALKSIENQVFYILASVCYI